MSRIVSPDCRDRNHQKCPGDALDEVKDQVTDCQCPCHVLDPAFDLATEMRTELTQKIVDANLPQIPMDKLGEHSINVMASRGGGPTTHAMQARHLSGASIGKTIEWDVGRSLLTGEHQWSPAATLGSVSHGQGWTELGIEWDEEHEDQQQLHPDDWVRITAPTQVSA